MSSSERPSEETLAPGTTLGRYEIARLLGRGGMGAVYEAIHRDLKKRVAIKVLSATQVSEDSKQRFLREGEAASRIQHPNVVDVTDVGVEGGLSYLVMEFLEGEDLSNRLAREGSLTPRLAADILLPVCAGLAVAHDEGVIHRDLKPENIFLVRQRQGAIDPKVLDFGISKLTGRNAAAMTGTVATFGTPFYMPPEQVRGARQADERSDVYALGVVLYECVTGRRPFEADNIYTMLHAIGAGQYPPPRAVQPDLSPSLEAVIVRAMRLEPADRFPSVRHLAAALLPFASDKARVVWSETFSGVEDLPAETAPPRLGGSSPTPGGKGGSVSGTQILPTGDQPFSRPANGKRPSHGTTLGSATGDHLQSVVPRRSRVAVVLAGIGSAGAVALLAFFFLRQAPIQVVETPAAPVTTGTPARTARAVPATFAVRVEADPPTATLEIDGVPTGARVLRREFSLDGQEHRLVGRAPGYRDAVVTFVDAPPPPHLSLQSAVAAKEPRPPKEDPSIANAAGAHPRVHHHQKAVVAPAAPEGSSDKNRVPVID